MKNIVIEPHTALTDSGTSHNDQLRKGVAMTHPLEGYLDNVNFFLSSASSDTHPKVLMKLDGVSEAQVSSQRVKKYSTCF